MTENTVSLTISPLPLGRELLKELDNRTFELGQACMDFDDLVRADRVRRVEVRLVLGPLRAAFTEVEQVTVGAGAVDVDHGVLEIASADALTLVWFQLRLLQ
jgi:hypothetical protein